MTPATVHISMDVIRPQRIPIPTVPPDSIQELKRRLGLALYVLTDAMYRGAGSINLEEDTRTWGHYAAGQLEKVRVKAEQCVLLIRELQSREKGMIVPGEGDDADDAVDTPLWVPHVDHEALGGAN